MFLTNQSSSPTHKDCVVTSSERGLFSPWQRNSPQARISPSVRPSSIWSGGSDELSPATQGMKSHPLVQEPFLQAQDFNESHQQPAMVGDDRISPIEHNEKDLESGTHQTRPSPQIGFSPLLRLPPWLALEGMAPLGRFKALQDLAENQEVHAVGLLRDFGLEFRRDDAQN